MSSIWKVGVVLGVLAGMPVTVEIAPWAWRQTSAGPGAFPPTLPRAAPNPADGGGNAWLADILLVVGLILVIVAAAKIIGSWGRRETDMMLLQAGIAEALMRDRALSRLPVVPTAHLPILRGSPVTIEVSGRVPTPELRKAALRVVEQEASRIRLDVHIQDRLELVASSARRAAWGGLGATPRWGAIPAASHREAPARNFYKVKGKPYTFAPRREASTFQIQTGRKSEVERTTRLKGWAGSPP